MTGPGPAHPNDRESEINALLDGELDQASATALKSAAAHDAVLAKAIIEAWQLQKSMDRLQLEKAPESLRHKLKRIPRENPRASARRVFALPQRVMAGGLAAVLLAAVLMMFDEPAGPAATNSQALPESPAINTAQAEQARRELATAFHYIDKVGLRLGRQIQEVLSDEISAPVKDNISRHMPYIGKSRKEKNV